MGKPAVRVAEVVLHVDHDDGGTRKVDCQQLGVALNGNRTWRQRRPYQIRPRLGDGPAVACGRAGRPQLSPPAFGGCRFGPPLSKALQYLAHVSVEIDPLATR